ncbi:hypothetical protein GHT06_019054 [Daphnia sinensis]|uniref:Uncharacterized protein n=1 Tax=Daphnia sinensis TaxID=1820382 RepID=A0AAD5L212_9CRUS|nr:hypothetical protein GHT06_019054 [Daphnia sinensis]
MLNDMHNLTYNMYCYLVFPELVSKATAVIQLGTQASSRSSPAASTSSRHVAEETNFSSAEEINNEILKKIGTSDDRKFVLNLVGTLYSPQYLLLHKKSCTKATHGDDLKIPIPQFFKILFNDCILIIFICLDAICSMLNVKLKKHRLPPKLENAISQKFNRVRPTAADKRRLRQYWKRQKTSNP